MKKIIFLIFVLILPVLAQDNRNVELPDFVIIGKRKTQLPTKEKLKVAGSIFTDEYLKPAIPLDYLKISDFKNINIEIPNNAENNKLNGRLDFGLGFYTWPEVELMISKSFKNSYLITDLYGINEREYTKKSGVNNLKINALYNLFIPNDYDFLPNSKMSLGGGYDRKISNFFASKFENIQNHSRTTHNLYFSAALENKNYDNFQFSINYNQHFLFLDNIKNKDYENILKFNFFPSVKIYDFILQDDFDYKNQSFFSNDSLLSDTYLLDNTFKLKYNISNNFALMLGIYSSAYQGEKIFVRPHISYNWRIDDYLWFKGEYSPRKNLLTVNDILQQNFYASLNEKTILNTQTYSFKFALDYQYYKYLQNIFAININKYKKFYYYSYNDSLANYDLINTKASEFNIQNTLIYNTLYYGLLTSIIDLNIVKDDNNKKIPFIPLLNIQFIYQYNYGNFTFEPNVNIAIKNYTDLKNNENKNFIDLGIKTSYKFAQNADIFIKFNNITNSKNYLYNYYLQKKFEVLGGLIYKW